MVTVAGADEFWFTVALMERLGIGGRKEQYVYRNAAMIFDCVGRLTSGIPHYCPHNGLAVEGSGSIVTVGRSTRSHYSSTVLVHYWKTALIVFFRWVLDRN